MAPEEPQICEAFGALVDLATEMGVKGINALPGCWEIDLDDRWHVAVNAHEEPVDVKPPGCMPFSVPPFETACWYNGWLAGLFGPYGGVVVAADKVSEDDLIAAIASKRASLAKKGDDNAVEAERK